MAHVGYHPQGPDSKAHIHLNRDIIKAEDLPVSLTRRSEAPLRRSPDSSTSDMPVGSFRCPQCPFSCQDESGFSDHLLCVHRIRLVKTEPGAAAAATTTRCPVCRQLVTDLSHHFAMEHAEKKTVNNNNTSSSNGIFGAAAGKLTIMNGSVTSSSNGNFAQMSDAAKVIPIFLPNHPLPESQLGRKNSNGSVDDSVTPMNLSLRRSSDAAVDNGVGAFDLRNNNNDDVGNVIPRPFSTRSKDDSEDFEESASNFSGEFQSGPGSSENSRKRRKQTHVPQESKDDKYWARRMKNNEAAKRSRDMRIKREKVVFEENARLEQENRDLRSELDRVTTENKELHLKMGIILEENARLKSIIYSMQQNGDNDDAKNDRL